MEENKNAIKARERYRELFPNNNLKAEAFDKIAEKYYYGNFGSTSKSDFDTLMFSIYLERILEKSESDIFSYSDYNLSKYLGITQSKVSSLKVKKELLYPYDKFDWRESLERISERAIFEDGKIKLFIPDRNLYLEIKNAIEEAGGFIEVQLTSNLLQVRLPYFLDLMVAIEEKEDRNKTRKEIIKIIKKKTGENSNDFKEIEKQSIGRYLAETSTELSINIISDVISVLGGPAGVIASNIIHSIYNQVKKGENKSK